MKTNKFRLFKNSNIYKSTFTFISLISILVLSTFILFSIKSLPLSQYAMVKTSHKTSLIFIIWYSGFIINRNLHISKRGDMFSYFMALFLNTFLIALVIYRWNYSPKNSYDYYESYYYFLGLFLFKTFWTFILYFVEKKTRPYFAKYLFWYTIASLMGIIIFVAIKLNFQRYLVENQSYNYLEIFNLLIILFIPIVFIIFIFSSIKGYSHISKYALEEKMISREIIIWNSFIRIASLAIWAVWSIGIDINNFKMYDKIFAGVLGFCLLNSLITTIICIVRKNNRLLIYILNTNLIIMSASGFSFVNILTSTPTITFLLFILFVFSFQFVFILLKPTLYKFYAQMNAIFVYMLMIFIVIIWIGTKIIGEIDIFNINEIIWGILVSLSIFMFVLYTSIELYISIRINFKFSKLIKKQKIKIKKAIKKIKGVTNG